MNQTLKYARRRILGVASLAALLLQGATAQEVITLPKKVFGTGSINAATYSPDGTLIVTANEAGAYLWDATSGEQIRRFPGPIEEVHAVAFSPDGSQVATVSTISGVWQGVRLWDVTTGHQVWETEVGVCQVDFSADGQTILTRSEADSGDFVALWDTATGQLLHNLILPSGRDIHDAAFSPDSSKVVTANGEERTVGIWDADTGQRMLTLWGHTNRVTLVAFSPDGSKVLSASRDSTVRLWDAATGDLLQTLDHQYGGLELEGSRSAVFSPDGEKVLTGATYWWANQLAAVVVRLWDAQTGQQERIWEYTSQVPGPSGVGLGALCMSRDGTKALAAVTFMWNSVGYVDHMYEWTVELLDLVNGGTVLNLPVEDNARWAILSPDCSSAVVAERSPWNQTGGTEARLWDLAASNKIADLGFQRRVDALDLSSEGTTLATASDGGTVAMWDADSGQQQRHFDWPDHPGLCGIDLSPDGSRLLVTAEVAVFASIKRYSASLWNPSTGELVYLLGVPNDELYWGEFSPDGQQVLLGGWAAGGVAAPTLSLWDVESGTCIRAFPGLPTSGNIGDVNFSPAGDRVLIAVCDTGVLMWDAATGASLGSVPLSQQLNSACFSPDGTQILTALPVPPPGSIVLWDISTGEQVRTFVHARAGDPSFPGATLARFSPDGKWVLTRHLDDIRIWDAASGEHLCTMYGRMPSPFESDSVAFSPDNRSLFAVANGAVAQWELVANPEISISGDGDGHIVLTWQDPSGATAYILQQRANLSNGDWTDVIVTTPGQYETNDVVGQMFYRLKEP